MFPIYVELGFDHILDFQAYDHILFIIALCAVYHLREWRHILILVTAFTVGHSLTLALAALDVVAFSANLVEFLIPVTILLTAFYNVFQKETASRKVQFNYALALFFGLIHGLGFSNYFRALLGQEESIVVPLFAFNIGVELGQLVIVSIALVMGTIVMKVLKGKQREWNLFLSGAAAGIALILILEARL